ncbi:MAG: F0F1 ATP synthase subunit delta [Candidatus Levybacteria bacterium]|nr:F0F1 ATP synthase subunit delta [Candidatus Levybacteria bacterium]
MEQNILNLINTSEEKEEFINFLEGLLENIYKEHFQPIAKDSSMLVKNFWDCLNLQIAQRKITNNKEEIEKFLNSLLQEIRKLSSVKLTIALSPTDELINAIGKWAQKNLSQKIIFDIEVDKKILGGAIIISDEGRFMDYSLRRKIDYVFSMKEPVLR